MAAKIEATGRQVELLESLSVSRSEPGAFVQRAKVILLARDGLANRRIASLVGLERHQVGLWRTRWAAAYDALCVVERTRSWELAAALRECLRDAPRSGSPGLFTAQQVTSIIDLACQAPQLAERPITRWTVRELHDEILKQQIVPSISRSQVGYLLRTAAVRPHREKMWLNTTERDAELFLTQAQTVCEAYLTAKESFARDSLHTVCVDEMTGLQALERQAPDKLTKPGKDRRREANYRRHGTTTLIGSWDVVAGQMIETRLGKTRTERDFLKHLQATVAQDEAGRWRFIMDNLNVHCSASLVKWVAKLEGIKTRDLGKKGRSGILKDQASRRAFLSDRTHRIHFVYVPKHSSWLNQIEPIFGMVNRKVMRGGDFDSVADLEDKLRRFVAYFNKTMAGPMTWTYTGKPTQTQPVAKFCPPHRRITHPSKTQAAVLRT
jgi:transposase